MSENSEPIVEEQNIQPISHQRILVLMAAAIIAGCIWGLIFISVSFAVGILIGGILSFINYYWLKQSLKSIFEKLVSEGEKPRFLATKYVLRYAVFGVLLALVSLTKAVPVVAVIAGLASFAVAVMIEGFIRLFSSLFNKKEI
jgi:uncharacterized membrane protein YjjP (DUF1212 family)